MRKMMLTTDAMVAELEAKTTAGRCMQMLYAVPTSGLVPGQ